MVGGSVAGGSVAGGSVAGGSVAGGSVAGGSVVGGSVAGASGRWSRSGRRRRRLGCRAGRGRAGRSGAARRAGRPHRLGASAQRGRHRHDGRPGGRGDDAHGPGVAADRDGRHAYDVAGVRGVHHQPAPEGHRDVVDGAGVGWVEREEHQVAGEQRRPGHGDAGPELVAGDPRQAHAGRRVRRTRQPGAVERLRPGGSPDVRRAEVPQRVGHGSLRGRAGPTTRRDGPAGPRHDRSKRHVRGAALRCERGLSRRGGVQVAEAGLQGGQPVVQAGDHGSDGLDPGVAVVQTCCRGAELVALPLHLQQVLADGLRRVVRVRGR